MVNTNTNTAAPRATYRIKRRTPRARGLSWAGTILFILTIPAIFLAISFVRFYTDTQTMIVIAVIFVLFALAIAFWIMSGASQNGVLSFYDTRVSVLPEKTILTTFPLCIAADTWPGIISNFSYPQELTILSS